MTLRDVILPPPYYAHYGRAKSCDDSIGRVLGLKMIDDALIAKAPLSHDILAVHSGSTAGGWDLLWELLKGCIPYLGVTTFDIASVIKSVYATNGMLFSNFVQKAQKAQHAILVSGLATMTNKLLKRLF